MKESIEQKLDKIFLGKFPREELGVFWLAFKKWFISKLGTEEFEYAKECRKVFYNSCQEHYPEFYNEVLYSMDFRNTDTYKRVRNEIDSSIS